MIICIDFDGTMVKHEYPLVGDENPYAFLYMRKFIEHGAKIVLFTMRSGVELQQAVDCIDRARIMLHGVNVNPDQLSWTTSPKAYGQLYIDDAAFGCPLIHPEEGRPYVDWKTVGPEVLKLLNVPQPKGSDDEL